MQSLKTGNSSSFLFLYVYTPVQSPFVLFRTIQNCSCFLWKSVSCVVSLSHTLFSSSPASFLLFYPLLFITYPHVHCVARMFVYVFFFFFFGASVSPCWQRGITAPGIESSSQAFGWRSTSQMKRMLVHLKVAAELPVDVFAVTLSVIFNPGWFGFHFQGFLEIGVAFLSFLCVF